MAGTAYPDTVAQGTYPIDVHHSDNAGITYRYLGGYEYVHNDRCSPPQVNHWRTDGDYARYYQVPFRTLVQDKVRNLIPVGRMLNADASAFGAVRVMVNLNFSPNSWKNCRAGQGVGAVAIGDEAEAFRELPEVSESHAQAAAVLRGEPGNFLQPLF